MYSLYTWQDTHIFSFFIHSQYLHAIWKWKRLGFCFISFVILFSSICLNEAVAQLTDEQRWWRHRVRCCSNRRYVLACSQVCAWSTDLPSTCLQVIESVVRVLGIEKRPQFEEYTCLMEDYQQGAPINVNVNKSTCSVEVLP